MKKILLIAILSTSLSAPVRGQDVPVPKSKIESLKSYRQQLDDKKAQLDTGEMKKEMKRLEGDLGDVRAQLVTLAEKIQGNEKDLAAIEQNIETLQMEKTALDQSLQENRLSISKLLLALERIRRVPPQALIAKPEAPLKTAQSAMLLSHIIPTLNSKAEELRRDIEKQSVIEKELVAQRAQALKQSATLAAEQNKLGTLASQRESIFKSVEQDYKAREIEADEISKQSRNVADLVSRLEDNKKRQEARMAARAAVLTAPKAEAPAPAINAPEKDVPKKPAPEMVVAMPKAGAARLPISGVIKARYNDLDKFGAKSEGIRIEGREGGLVVAPMSGIVRFAGPFKGYDRMVIIEHENQYHSLVAGLGSVDVMVGEKISAGEPVGKLKSATKEEKPTLYYELRHKGNAIDPARKFSDLG